jgi:hypothetical protein
MPAMILTAALLAQAMPPGPQVPISDGWYHVATCPIAQGRKAPSVPLAEALRQKLRPCPICEPHTSNAEVGAFVAAHGTTIADQVRRQEEAEAAEAKRKEDERVASLERRIAEADDARKNRAAAPLVRVEEAQVRQLAEAAAALAKGDPQAFQRAFRTAVRGVSPDYAGPQTVFGSGALRIVLSGPLAKFETAAMTALGQGQPIGRVAWSAEATVAVLPQQPEAPDIERIVVQRSDASRPLGSEIVIAPLATTLATRPVQFASGATRMMHAGEVVFPLSAFDPGEGVMVRVIAVPAGAAPINRTFTALQLRAVQ